MGLQWEIDIPDPKQSSYKSVNPYIYTKKEFARVNILISEIVNNRNCYSEHNKELSIITNRARLRAERKVQNKRAKVITTTK